MFNPSSFIREIESQLREAVGENVALAAVSGGVDSTTAAALSYRVLGDRVIPVMIDTGFLRKDEARKVKQMLSGLMPLEVIDASGEFLKAVEGLDDAEEKRKAFRDTFYNLLSRVAKEKGASILIQGTIAADWVETQGGIKSQHNVLVQLGVNVEQLYGLKFVEPLADLYKNEVRILAKFLGLPDQIAFRQPFPGPGLLVRVVGKVNERKLEICREANELLEPELRGFSQYFAAVFEKEGVIDSALSDRVGMPVRLYKVKATGVKGDVRAYGKVSSISFVEGKDYAQVIKTLTSSDITRVLLRLWEGEGDYAVAVRAVRTEDFMTADAPLLSKEVIDSLIKKLSNVKGVGEVLYEVTSKPPATIEFE